MINKFFNGSVTVLTNQNNILPFRYGDTATVAVVVVGDEDITAFEQTFATLKLRVEKMLELPLETLPKNKLTAELNAIGQLTA